MIVPTSFAIHVTYTCPLVCAHCCFSSSPADKHRLPLDHIVATIEQLDPEVIQLIAFTGGEPFLLGNGLVQLINLATQRGLSTRIVTSAFFGKTPKLALDRLKAVQEVGLKELTISWDDFHEEFVDFQNVAHVFQAAQQLGITVCINMVQGAAPRWTPEKVAQELGIPLLPSVIYESPLNRTGRAEMLPSNTSPHPNKEMFLGPCPYILSEPALSAKNKLLACCGVIPETQELIISDNFNPLELAQNIQQAQLNPLYNWLYLRGPYQILEWISNRFGGDIPSKQTVGGNCEACKILFHTDLRNHLPQALEEMKNEIFQELALLEALGLLRGHSIRNLWNQK